MVESLNQDFGQKTIKGIPWNELKFKFYIFEMSGIYE